MMTLYIENIFLLLGFQNLQNLIEGFPFLLSLKISKLEETHTKFSSLNKKH